MTPLELKQLFLGDRPTLTLRDKSQVYQGTTPIQLFNAFRNERFSQVHLNFGNESNDLVGRVFTLSPSYGLYVLKTQGPYVLSSANYDLTEGTYRAVDTEFMRRDLTGLFQGIQELQLGACADELFKRFLRDNYAGPRIDMNFIDCAEMNFCRDTVLKDRTSIIEQGHRVQPPYDIPAEYTRIGIGVFYEGQLPKGTEEVMLINLPGIGQIIEYMHRARNPDGSVEMKGFKSTFMPIGQELRAETFR
jgi:hypothetical protein